MDLSGTRLATCCVPLDRIRVLIVQSDYSLADTSGNHEKMPYVTRINRAEAAPLPFLRGGLKGDIRTIIPYRRSNSTFTTDASNNIASGHQLSEH
jgi:hypothetical protein